MNTFWHIIIIFAAFGGLLLTLYIRRKKQKQETMVCPFDSDCDAVIYSEYSKFFGIPIEILGLFYYGTIAAAYALFLAFPELAPSSLVFTVLTTTVAALLFSFYLIFLQAFAIKQWCTWCLASAGICVIIFASALAGSESRLFPLLFEYRDILGIIHLIGIAIGVGGATIADIFFFRFLKDFRVSERESDMMRAFSNILWFAQAILVISGIGLYLPEIKRLIQSPEFLVKAIVVAVIIINGAISNLLVAPKLVKISFGEKYGHEDGKIRRIRRTAFALGAISVVSWYAALILNALPKTRFGLLPVSADSTGFISLLAAYLLLLFTAIFASQIFERAITKKARATNNH